MPVILNSHSMSPVVGDSARIAPWPCCSSESFIVFGQTPCGRLPT